ncbi:MAG: uracil-DNA glycosylase [Syntrophomonadaceae bacterium]|nr:uracil-DNA glycosylase [Syntrophomonadaceae bacterium]
MVTEQPGLFESLQPERKGQQETEDAGKEFYLPFIPGVKAEESYLDIGSYDDLKAVADKCSKCRLRNTCKQVVFGEGSINSGIMFIGEGPGRDEDIQGRPFVGKAGQLLDKILQAAGMERKEIYISNVVKCRPPGNRLPNPDEVRECRNYLEAQIRIIRPEIIVCLGAMASQVVIDPKARISTIRGRWFVRNGVKIIATYHPAALLRNESYKRPVWEDFKKIRDEYKKITG